MSKNGVEKGVLTTFILEHKERFYRVAYSYVQDPDDALDVVQESIYKAISSRKSLSRQDALKPWFYRIIINTSYDLLRKKKRLRLVDEKFLELNSPLIEDDYQDVDLENALSSMPDQYKNVIVLRFFEDLKIEEVAQILDQNVNTVKTRLYKALAMLRIQMDDVKFEEGR